MSYKYGKRIAADGLVFYVDAANNSSYNGSSGGLTWADLVGDNDGTLINMQTNPSNAGYAYDSGNGGSIEFDGTNDYAAFSSSATLVPGSDDYSIMFWAKYNGPALTSSSVIEGVFQKGVYYQTGGELQITFRGGSLNGIYFRLRDSSSISQVVPSTDISSTIGNGSFHHYACIIDRSSNELKLYFDGSLAGTTSGISPSSIDTTQQLRIGRYENFYGNAQLSNLSIYNDKALSASEVLQNYNALKDRFV